MLSLAFDILLLWQLQLLITLASVQQPSVTNNELSPVNWWKLISPPYEGNYCAMKAFTASAHNVQYCIYRISATLHSYVHTYHWASDHFAARIQGLSTIKEPCLRVSGELMCTLPARHQSSLASTGRHSVSSYSYCKAPVCTPA